MVSQSPHYHYRNYKLYYASQETQNKCIKVSVKSTHSSANSAAENGHLDYLNRRIETGIKPISDGANLAAGN